MRISIASVYVLAFASVFFLYCTVKGADVCGSDKSATIQVILSESLVDNGSVSLFESKDNAPRMTCTWQITAPQGYSVVLVVRLDKNIEEKTKTTVFDGNSSSDALLWNSNETSFPEHFRFTLLSSGEHMRVVLMTGNTTESDLSSAYVYIQPIVSYYTNNQVVNLNASSTVAKFTSPYYPTAYPLNVSCVWRIHAPAGKLVRLEFLRLFVQKNDVQIYDREEPNEHSLGEYNFFSSFVRPTVIFSYTQSLVIKFNSGSIPRSYLYKGFEMEYSAVEPGCSVNNPGVFNASVGSISTPGFPSAVPTEAMACIWSFIAPLGHVIKLDLDTINLDSHINNDPALDIKYLSIYEKGRFDVHLGGRNYTSRTSISSGRKIQVMYNKPEYKVGRSVGVIAKYTAIPLVTTGSCAPNQLGTISLKGEAATFHSLNYPKNHPGNMNCMWNITVASGQVIELRIGTYYFNSDCDKEYIKIYDGPTKSSPLITKLCQIRYEKKLYSRRNHLAVEFIGKIPSKGFAATYIARKSAPKPYACPASDSFYDEMEGMLASWGFPLSYPNNVECDWYIKVPPEYIVNFTLMFFDIQPDPSCSKDYLSLFEVGEGRRIGKEITKICGKNITQVSYQSTSRKMMAEFRSDSIGMYPGFEAKFEAVKKPPESTRKGGSKVSTTTIVLIVVFSVLGVIGLTILIICIIKYRYHCCADRNQGNFDMVKMDDADDAKI